MFRHGSRPFSQSFGGPTMGWRCVVTSCGLAEWTCRLSGGGSRPRQDAIFPSGHYSQDSCITAPPTWLLGCARPNEMDGAR
jgi:hypothetical protein